MIDDSVEVFPGNACKLIVVRAQTIDPDLRIVQRPVRDSDGTQVVGIFPMTWTPDESSFENPGNPQFFAASEPTLARYLIGVQAFVKETDEEKGIRIHNVLAKRLRTLLYRDQPLAVGLATLSVSMSGSVERIQKRGIQTQRYLASEIEGVFIFLSSAEYYLETETV